MNPEPAHSGSPGFSRLVIETGDQRGMVFPLRDAIVSIGRGPDNTIQVIDTRMSRSHSLLIRNGAIWFARDLGSRNGTLLNDSPVEADRSLSSGDRLQIGDTVFVFEHEAGPNADADRTTGIRVLDDDGSIKPSRQIKLRRDEPPASAETPGTLRVPVNDAERLSALYEVGDLIGSIFDLDELLGRVLDLAQQFLQPDRAAVLLYDEQYHILVPKASRRPPKSRDELIISTSIIGSAVGGRSAVLVCDAPHDFRFKSSDSVILQRIQSAICVPFLYKDSVLGVIYLDRRSTVANFDENDLKLAAGIANQSALAIANLRLHHRLVDRRTEEREIEIAREIQEKLLPAEMPELPGFELAGFSRPARMVGGDYYDVIALSDGRYVLVVADVSGKGVPAAILLAAVRAAVQIEVRGLKGDAVAEVMDRLNQMVWRDTSSNMFVTMFLGVLDPGKRTFTYCNAGHVHPMIGHPDGHIQFLETGGCFLGMIPGAVYDIETIDLPVDSTLMIYSDGVIDIMNQRQDMFGLQRLIDFLGSAMALSADDFCAKLETRTIEFREAAEPNDDLTLLVLRSVAR